MKVNLNRKIYVSIFFCYMMGVFMHSRGKEEKAYLLATSSISSFTRLNSSFSCSNSSCCSNRRSVRSSRICAHRLVTCSICSSSAVVNKRSSFFVSFDGWSVEGVTLVDTSARGVPLVAVDTSGWGARISGCNVAVWTSGNKTFSPF